MKKLFISQPMRGRTDEEINAERAQAVRDVQCALGEEVQPLDTFFTDYDGEPLEFLGKSIMMMAHADVVHFCTGWENARGCRVERSAAENYDVPIV